MAERLNTLLPVVQPKPQIQQLKLPKLKKIGEKNPELPKLKLPKLKKIEA